MTEEVNVASVSPAPSITNPRQPRRIKLTDEQLETISHDALVASWKELDLYVDFIETQTASQDEVLHLRECEERIKQQYSESTHREKVLVRRLATKEQEMQEYINQIAELKSEKAPGAAALRSALLDPAVNFLLQRLRQELVTTKAKLDETQNELNAWKFTPDSNTGKRLMAKCRLLYQENEELGRIISSGRLAKLEGDLALQKNFSDEVKKSQSELDEFLQDLDEDVEGMQSTIYYLQQELRKAKEQGTNLQQEIDRLKSGVEASNPVEMLQDPPSSPAKEPTSPPPEPSALPAPEGQEKSVIDVPEWENSSDSGELILNIEAEDTEEIDVVQTSPKLKRSFESVSGDVPATKKVRRDSEISLHYSEDEELTLKSPVEEEGSDDNIPLAKVQRNNAQ